MIVAELRAKIGMDRKQFARALGVSDRTVERWESGTRPEGLAGDVLMGIADAIESGVGPAAIGRVLSSGVRQIVRGRLVQLAVISAVLSAADDVAEAPRPAPRPRRSR